jgi:hypothetical protein
VIDIGPEGDRAAVAGKSPRDCARGGFGDGTRAAPRSCRQPARLPHRNALQRRPDDIISPEEFLHTRCARGD